MKVQVQTARPLLPNTQLYTSVSSHTGGGGALFFSWGMSYVAMSQGLLWQGILYSSFIEQVAACQRSGHFIKVKPHLFYLPPWYVNARLDLPVGRCKRLSLSGKLPSMVTSYHWWTRSESWACPHASEQAFGQTFLAIAWCKSEQAIFTLIHFFCLQSTNRAFF